MSVLASSKFYVAVAERALKTAAQSLVAVLTTDVTGILDVDPVQAASVVGLAALVSVATSFASIPVSGDGPSLAGESLTSKRVPTHRAEPGTPA